MFTQIVSGALTPDHQTFAAAARDQVVPRDYLARAARARGLRERRVVRLIITATVLCLATLVTLSSTTSASAAPDLRWGRTWLDPPYVQAVFSDVAVDGAGATYAVGAMTAGTGYWDIVLTKHSAGGLRLYTRLFAGPAGKHDYAFAVAVRAGVVAITGRTTNAAGGNDVLTIAWTTGGKRLWTRRVRTDSSRSTGQDVAVTDKGAVVVTGQVATGPTGDDDILVVKYARSGAQLWKKRIDGRGNGNDSGAAVMVDSGNVYLAGAVVRVAPGADLLLVKFSSSGKVLWQQRWSDGSETHYEYASSLAVRNGRVAVAGAGQSVTDRPSALVARYDTSGRFQWANLDEVGTGTSRFAGVGIDKRGNVVAGGERQATNQPDEEADFYVARYLSSGGTQAWAYTRGGGGQDLARCTGLVVTGSGDIIATGFEQIFLHGTQAFTVSLSPAMAENWSSPYGTTDQNYGANAIALGGGGVSVGGSGQTSGLVLRYGLAPLP